MKNGNCSLLGDPYKTIRPDTAVTCPAFFSSHIHLDDSAVDLLLIVLVPGFANMALQIKNALISDPLDKSAIEILEKAGITADVRTGLKADELIQIIPVSHLQINSNLATLF